MFYLQWYFKKRLQVAVLTVNIRQFPLHFSPPSLPYQVDANYDLSSPVSVKIYTHTGVLWQKYQIFLHMKCINGFLQKVIVIVLQIKFKTKFNISPHQAIIVHACQTAIYLKPTYSWMVCACTAYSVQLLMSQTSHSSHHILKHRSTAWCTQNTCIPVLER